MYLPVEKLDAPDRNPYCSSLSLLPYLSLTGTNITIADLLLI